MRINYVTTADDRWASFRYHIKTPAMELAKLGHDVVFSDNPVEHADAYIFHKHLRAEETFMIIDVKKSNPQCKTYFVVCDYHLHNKYRSHYLTMINRADQVVVCVDEMKKIIKEEAGKDSVVIKDPWGLEYKKQKPHFRNKDIYNLLWFGNKVNLKGLWNVWDEIGNHNLTIITNTVESGDYFIKGRKCRVYWFSPDILQREMGRSDIVIIPQDLSDKMKVVKTHNRLVDSLRMGKFVIASPVPSYKDLQDYCFLGSVRDGIWWANKNRSSEVEKRISAGQEYIEKTFSPEVIGKEWDRLLNGNK